VIEVVRLLSELCGRVEVLEEDVDASDCELD